MNKRKRWGETGGAVSSMGSMTGEQKKEMGEWRRVVQSAVWDQ